ncbi:MAG: hypothetical protein OXF79_20265 [Chloroflexi bacterium]|nr:hypothetical protein [Chloroflexota bacterium]
MTFAVKARDSAASADDNAQYRDEIVDALMQHYVFARVLLQEHQDLFHAKANEWFLEAHPEFAWWLRRVSEEALILRITQLADRPETGGNRNLTVRALPDLYPQLHRLPALVKAVMAATADLRQYRNKVVAHLDRDGKGRRPFGEEFPEHAERSLDAVLAVLDEVRGTATAREVVSGDPCRQLIHDVATLVNLGRTAEALTFGQDGHSLKMESRAARARGFLEKLELNPDDPQHWLWGDRLCLASATLQHYEKCPIHP